MLYADVSLRNAQAEDFRTAAVNGSIVIKSSTGQTLVTIALGSTPFNAASGGGVSLAAAQSGVAAASGKASYFELYRSNSTLVVRGSIGSAAGDLVLSSTTITSGDTVQITALAYYVPQ